ncbi:MAG: SRPBCC family protein [Nitrosopumilus sp.]|nr:SRPBCC family protein [Nitrosopumilus sp.]MDH3765638.1 SRPBCC family protein [Nitrosopumilus sp.]
MSRLSFEITVDAKRETVYDVLSNYENYQKILPQHFPSVRIRSVRNNVSVVEEHLILGDKELLIMAKHVTTEPVLHEVFVIGGDAKGSYIKEQFVKLSEGTKVLVDVDLKLKGKMKLSSLFGKNKLEQEYGIILDDFVKIAEG